MIITIVLLSVTNIWTLCLFLHWREEAMSWIKTAQAYKALLEYSIKQTDEVIGLTNDFAGVNKSTEDEK